MAFSGIPGIRSGCLTPTFSGAQKRAEVLCHPCVLGGPLHKGRETKMARTGLLEKIP